ncbi:MAG: hypothetical protein ACE3JN_17625 [Ectobacillus sp.]
MILVYLLIWNERRPRPRKASACSGKSIIKFKGALLLKYRTSIQMSV